MLSGEEVRAWIPAGGFGAELHVFDSIDSTNTTAGELARAGAPEGTLVVADSQRRGRGRGGSHWATPAGSAVAMSLVLRPEAALSLRWSGLGALAVVDGLRAEGLQAQIKWPNDVLLAGRKVAGVLAEAAWEGQELLYLILGIGVNVSRASVQSGAFDFPATWAEAHASHPIGRARLISEIVVALGEWYGRLPSADFIRAWEARLAYRGEEVQVEEGSIRRAGRLLGLSPEGEARLLLADGREVSCGAEASRLRPAAS